jgi:DNA-binding SARP family transcriptional activator
VPRVPCARHHFDPRHRCDRRERLAAEAERGHGFELIERPDLAGRVAREREGEVLACDPGAVVVHLHPPRAAFDERHAELARAGIEAVFDQLLEHRRRPLDHLAGRDLADEQLGQDAYRAHLRPTRSGRARRECRA